MMRRSLSLAIALLAGSTATAQEPTLSLSISHAAQASEGGSDGLFTGALSVGRSLASDRLRLSYDLEGGDFKVAGNWAYLAHEAGATWRQELSSTRRLFAGGSVALRQNGASWAVADYRGAGAFANVELTPAPTSAFRAGYRVDVRRFQSEPRLDQREQEVFGSIRLNFATGTTVIGEATTGTKWYDEGAAGLPATARRLDVLVRVAQSVATRTGVSIEGARRRVSGDVQPLLVAVPPGFFDDGVYDDPFASDLDQVAATVRTMIGGGTTLEIGAAYEAKPYRATAALDAGGAIVAGTLRRDRLARAAATATVPVFPDRIAAVDVDLVVGYGYTRQHSTSALYDYGAHAVVVGAALRY